MKRIEFEKDSELKVILKAAFESYGLQQISIPDKVTRIENRTFFECAHMKCIEFTEKSELKSIGKYAFVHNAFGGIVLSPKLQFIDKFASS